MAAKKVTREDVIEYIKNMSVMDLGDFIKELEEIFGVSATQVTPATFPAQPTQEAEPEKTTFTVILTGYKDGAKIPVIKAVRAVVPGLGLAASKEFVEKAPQNVAEEVSKEEAESIKATLEKDGATIEIK